MPGSSDQKTSCMHDLGNMQALKHDTSQETKVMFHLKMTLKSTLILLTLRELIKKKYIIYSHGNVGVGCA